MRKLVWIIDSLSENLVKIICWLGLALVLVLCYEVVMRYVFNNPTVWAADISRMLGASFATLGLAYTLRHRGHVRVDVFYSRLSDRGKALVDVICTLLLFFPLLICMLYASVSWTVSSWSRGETWQMTAWYPPTGPIRTAISVGWCLFLIQAGAEFVRNLYFLWRGKQL